jgi:hypothetical protein
VKATGLASKNAPSSAEMVALPVYAGEPAKFATARRRREASSLFETISLAGPPFLG